MTRLLNGTELGIFMPPRAARVGELMAEASRDRARVAISVARVEHLEELLSTSEAARLKADSSTIELTKSLASCSRRIAELEDQLRSAGGDGQDPRKHLGRAESGRDETARQRANLDARLYCGEQIREEVFFEDPRQIAALADLDALRRENVSLCARLSMPAISKDVAENAALRTSIERFGWEARRVYVRRNAVEPEGSTGRRAHS